MKRSASYLSALKHYSAAAIAGFLLVGLSACSSSDGGFPPIANPPPFDYADGEELRDGMHQLAYELLQLDMAMISSDSQDSQFQREVVSVLENIERIGGRIRQTELSARHQFLLDDMSQFLSAVARAKRSAQGSPPRYYLSGQVSGACMNCHRSVN